MLHPFMRASKVPRGFSVTAQGTVNSTESERRATPPRLETQYGWKPYQLTYGKQIDSFPVGLVNGNITK